MREPALIYNADFEQSEIKVLIDRVQSPTHFQVIFEFNNDFLSDESFEKRIK